MRNFSPFEDVETWQGMKGACTLLSRRGGW